MALAAEAAGYGAVWVYDHLAGASIGGDTMLETFSFLGALAVCTSTIELGTLVVNVNNRTPGLLAVAAASIVAISGRPLHLGLGAGTSPTSRWAAEMHAVGQPIIATIGRPPRSPRRGPRRARPRSTTRTARPSWRRSRCRCRGPIVIVGVNSVALATVAGARADGINVEWAGRRRDELLAAAAAARGDRPGFLLTAWAYWSPDLVDPDSVERRAMDRCAIDRLVLVVPVGVGSTELGRPLPVG